MKVRRVLAYVLLVLCVATAILCSFPQIFPWDETVVRLFCETLPRIVISSFLIVVLRKSVLCPPKGAFWRSLLWCLPCFAVALVNFPFSALISGRAHIERIDLLWLFLLKCLSIALMEELFFRALLLPLLQGKLRNTKGKFYYCVLISAACFSLMHLLNLLFGAGFGATALQVGYTFLLGIMFGVMFLVTRNIWFCVTVHTVFDIGGCIVTDLGSGAFQDTVFWILTAVFGVICAVHIIISSYRFQKKGGHQKIQTEINDET